MMILPISLSKIFPRLKTGWEKKRPEEYESLAEYIQSRYIPEPALQEAAHSRPGTAVHGSAMFSAKAARPSAEEDFPYDACDAAPEIEDFSADRSEFDGYEMQAPSFAEPAMFAANLVSDESSVSDDLEKALKMRDESFSEMLFRKIDELGLTDSQCYRRANIDRKLFSKLRSNDYHPGKNTVLALAVALELPLDEVDEMLAKAGYALSRSSKADIIVDFYLKHGCYSLDTINEALYYYDQRLLGS